MPRGIKFMLPEEMFLRDPQDTEFGQRILKHSVGMIYDMGIEKFTFRKLASAMGSAEASIYRYFENKHSLLLYLMTWYWEWVHYVVDFNTRNVKDSKRALRMAIHSLIFASQESDLTSYINENILHKLIIQEGVKAFHKHDAQQETEKGVFRSYRELIEKLAAFTRSLNTSYHFHLTLASTLFEMTLSQLYYAEHIPQITDIDEGANNYHALENYLYDLSLKVLGVEEV